MQRTKAGHESSVYEGGFQAAVVRQDSETERPASRVVVLISRLQEGQGGVAVYFRALESALNGHVRYLSIGRRGRNSTLLSLSLCLCRDLRDIWNAARDDKVGVIQLNPSLVWKAVIREGVHILVAKTAGKRVLVFWHGWHWGCAHKLKRGLAQRLFMAVYDRADCHVVLAEDFRRELREMGCRGPIVCESTVASEPVQEAPVAKGIRRAAQAPVQLLFLSRVERDKGIYTAIDATTQVREAGYPVHLVVAGDGTERARAEEYVKRNKIHGITFVGYVTGKEKERILMDSDIYLFPSAHGEGMPLSLLDAMGAGLPVLCTRVGGLKDFFEDGKMGYFATTPSIPDFASLIEKVLLDRQKANAMGEYNRVFARQHFYAPVVGRRLVGIYDFVLSGGHPNEVPSDWMVDGRDTQEDF